MHQPTHAIRTQLHDDARTIALAIADNLSDIKPWQTIHHDARTHGPDLIAARHHGRNTYADQVATHARALMPLINRDMTRGEYALLLRAAVKEAGA